MRRTTITRLALAAAVALTLSACGGTESADVGGDVPAEPTTPATDVPATDGPTTDGPTTSEPAAPVTEEPTEDVRPTAPADPGFTVEPEGQELALVGGSNIEVLYTLPDEGESVFRAAALRPGATRDDMTVVVVTSAEGMYDLRWLEVTDGEVGELQVFPEQYNLPSDLMSRMELVPVPVWSPDGQSLGWVVPAEDSDAATLRTVGWSDGPGTGDTADDNAGFALEIGSSEAQARDWTADDVGRSVLRVETAAGEAFDVHLERQGDGALALIEVTPAQ